MINMIYGRAGSGKTTRICELAAESLACGRRVFLIVPEQMAVEAEAAMTALLDGRSSLSLEILNFKRLCNRVFREHGGLSYRYITKSGKLLMMWQTLMELAPILNTKIPLDRGSVAEMISAVNEFKAYRITPGDLERAAKRISESGSHRKLQNKLYDLSLVFASYTNLVAEKRDDASDDLKKAAEMIKNSPLFREADVFFDSFNGFTPAELFVVRELFGSARNVTVSLCLDAPPEKAGDDLFANQRHTAKVLKELAASVKREVRESQLTQNHRAHAPELKFLERSLWSLDLTNENAYRDSAPAISLTECGSLFAECEAVAVDICKRIRSGAKWKDIAIITRGLDRYDGILDVTLEKYGIPHYVSNRTDIKNYPLIKLILASLSLKHTGFRTSDVISYIKTGLTGLTPDEICTLENYVELWGIRGFARWSEEWTMNPAGYTADFTEDLAAKLEHINELRLQIMIPLTDLYTKLESTCNVRGYSEALYGHLIRLDVPKKLSENTEKLKKYDFKSAQETRQLFNVLIDSLDELCDIMPDFTVDAPTYCELLRILFDETDIGSIPGTVDEVVSGDASLLRKSAKHVYLIGANEGVFPLAPKNDGVFSDTERELLASTGLMLSGGTEYQSADERFAFYRALTSASKSVNVIWSSSDLSGHSMKPSFGASRLRALFPNVKPKKYEELPLTERMEGKANLLEFISEANTKDETSELASALKRRAKKDTAFSERVKRLSIPLHEGNTCLSKETAKSISGGDLALTQSRLDSYVLCHFSYFCKYILKLEERKPAKFDAANIGTFVHHILELFVSRAEENGGLGSITADEIDRMVDEIVANYMQTICRISPDITGSRIAHLFARLKRSSKLLCKNLAAEFSQSRFVPAFFELPIRFPKEGEKAVEPLTVKLDDGSKVYLYGIADRVDIFEHGDKLYVRVVDYKTGAKNFSLEEASMGLGMQMLLYLFSIWKNGANPDSALSYVKEREIIPAGVLYFSAGVPTVSLDGPASPEEVEKMASDKLSRKGLLLDDPDVLSAMDKELSGAYLPVKLKKDGNFSNPDNLSTLEGFAKILEAMESTIKAIGKEIKHGNAAATPMKTSEHDACAFCEMRPICRSTMKKGGEQ